MGRWKAIIPIGLALGIAMAGSYHLYNWLETRSTVSTVEAMPTLPVSPVAVAVMDLKIGTKISEEMLSTARYLQESIPPGAYVNATDLTGRVVISPIKKDEPILDSRLASSDVTSGGIAAVVKEGKRAVSVKGNKVIGISGLINPMNHVDVLVTIEDPKTEKEVTKMVLENILVLATGTEMQSDGKGQPAPVDVYTLEVTPEEGESLALASSKGTLQFALRNSKDKETVLTEGATVERALTSLFKPGPKKTRKTRTRRVARTYQTVEVVGESGVQTKKF